AEITFRRRVRVWIDVKGIVGARLQASFAADATIRIEIDDAVVASVERRHRADRYARSKLAVIAAHDRKQSAIVRKGAFLDVLHPGPIHADRHLVFALAGNSAGMTPDALAVVDHEPKCRHELTTFYFEQIPMARCQIWPLDCDFTLESDHDMLYS